MKHIVITGANSGIGMALTQAYLAEGYKVTACGRSQEKLAAVLGTNNPNLHFCTFDLSNRDEVMTNTAQMPAIDIVILNAGTCEYIDNPQQFDSLLFARVIQTNVMGTGFCLEAMLPKIKPGGQLAIVSSSVTVLPLTRAEAYGASKAALDYLTRALAIDLAPNKIDVSLIRPGFVDTPLTQKNNFAMPGVLSCDQASRIILKGIQKRKQEINFPRGFFYTMRCLSWLPNTLWRRIAIKMIRLEK